MPPLNLVVNDMEEVSETVEAGEAVETVAEARCNCNDEFRTETCPVHYKVDEYGKYNNKVLITDRNLVPGEIRQWAGYSYFCPSCGQPSIMDMMKYCGNCGVELELKSKKLTEFINKLSERNGVE